MELKYYLGKDSVFIEEECTTLVVFIHYDCNLLQLKYVQAGNSYSSAGIKHTYTALTTYIVHVCICLHVCYMYITKQIDRVCNSRSVTVGCFIIPETFNMKRDHPLRNNVFTS